MSICIRFNEINNFHDKGDSNKCSNSVTTVIYNRKRSLDNRKMSQNNIAISAVAANCNTIARKSTSTQRPASIRRNIVNKTSSAFIASVFIAATIFLLLGTLQEINPAQALECYHCSSADDPGCDESFSGKANYTGKKCSELIEKPTKVCRKIVQYIEAKKVVVRSCGYIDETTPTPAQLQSSASKEDGTNKNDITKPRESKCYKRSGTFSLMMESCNCYTDMCNHSANLVPSSAIIYVLTSAGLLYFLLSQSSLIRRANNLSI